MPLLSDYEEFDLTALEIDSVDFEGTKLSVDFGNDYGAFALPAGNNAGPKRWVISSGCLPDDEDYLNLVNAMPRFEYWVDFWQRHTTGDEEIFMIEFRGEHFHCKFAETTMSAGMESIDLFTTEGVEVVKRRVAGIAYNANGSIRFPYLALDAADLVTVEGYVDNGIAYQWTDHYEPTRVASSFGSPTLQTNEVNSLPVARFDGVDDVLAYPAGGSFTLYDIFLVAKVRSATFAADSGLVSSEVEDLLLGDSGTTKFTDLVITNYEYRKNGTLFADNDQQSPMNAYGVIHLRFTDGADFVTGVMNLGSTFDGGVFSPSDIAEVIGYDFSLSASQYASVTTALMTKYGLS